MAVNIKLKHSSVDGKAPVAADLENGELALNINENSPAAYIKNSEGQIVKLAGPGSVTDDDAVKKSETAVQNMVGDLTLGTDNITLDADNGGITALGKGEFGGTVSTQSLFLAKGSYNSQDCFRVTNNNIDKATIFADGSSNFKGRLDVVTLSTNDDLVAQFKNEDGGGTRQSSFQYTNDGELKLFGTSSNANPTVTIESDDGKASFAGETMVGDIYNGEGTRFLPQGEVYVRNDNTSRAVFAAYSGGTDAEDQTVAILADGSADFAGQVTGLGFTAPLTIDGQYAYRGTLNGNVTSQINADGSATFEGGISARTQDAERGLTIYSSSDSELEALAINANGGARKILLNHDGSAEFKGDVAIGDSDTIVNILGDAITLLPASITEQFETVINSLPVAQPFTGDPTTLPADIPTPLKDALVRVTTAGKINLNSNGSATFAGQVEIGNDIASGSGTRIYSNGALYLRSDISSGSSIFKYYNGGFTDADVRIDFKADGSASFSGNTFRIGDYTFNSSTTSGLDVDNGALTLQRPSSVDAAASRSAAGRHGADITWEIFCDGSAEFEGTVEAARVNAGDLTHPNPAVAATNGSATNGSIYARNNSGAVAPTFQSAGGDGSVKAVINNDGSASFAERIQSGGLPYDGEKGVATSASGTVYVSSIASSPIWQGYTESSTTPTSSISSDGSANFSGRMDINGISTGGDVTWQLKNANVQLAHGTNASVNSKSILMAR